MPQNLDPLAAQVFEKLRGIPGYRLNKYDSSAKAYEEALEKKPQSSQRS